MGRVVSPEGVVAEVFGWGEYLSTSPCTFAVFDRDQGTTNACIGA